MTQDKHLEIYSEFLSLIGSFVLTNAKEIHGDNFNALLGVRLLTEAFSNQELVTHMVQVCSDHHGVTQELTDLMLDFNASEEAKKLDSITGLRDKIDKIINGSGLN